MSFLASLKRFDGFVKAKSDDFVRKRTACGAVGSCPSPHVDSARRPSPPPGARPRPRRAPCTAIVRAIEQPRDSSLPSPPRPQ